MYPHPLPDNASDSAKQKDVNKIYLPFFLDNICVLYIILGFVNNVCLIFQKNNCHYLSIHYIVDLLLIGLKNTPSTSHLFVFSPSSSFCSPTPAQLQLESLVNSSSSQYPTSCPKPLKIKRKRDNDDEAFVSISSLQTSRTCRISGVKKNIDYRDDDDLEEIDGIVSVIQVLCIFLVL
jgi:hypothetical protein